MHSKSKVLICDFDFLNSYFMDAVITVNFFYTQNLERQLCYSFYTLRLLIADKNSQQIEFKSFS